MTEDQWKVHPAFPVFTGLAKALGIDMRVWTFGECSTYQDGQCITVTWYNDSVNPYSDSVDDIGMMVDFSDEDGAWRLQQFGMDLD